MILDLGCGKGNYLKYMKNAIGLDINLENLIEAKKWNKPLILGDICYLPFKDETFDEIFVHHVLEHVKEVKIALNEIRRTVKWRRIVKIYVPSLRTVYNDPTHIWFKDKYWWTNLIGKYFKLLNVELPANLPDNFSGKFNFIPIRFRKAISYFIGKFVSPYSIEFRIVGLKE